jgi:hypothetical protein
MTDKELTILYQDYIGQYLRDRHSEIQGDDSKFVAAVKDGVDLLFNKVRDLQSLSDGTKQKVPDVVIPVDDRPGVPNWNKWHDDCERVNAIAERV